MANSAAMIQVPYAAVEPTRAFEPSSIEEAYRLSKLLVASRLLPEGVATPEAAFAIIATGRELGLTAMQSLRAIHVIKGKPTLSADLVCALVKGRPDVCDFFRLVESTDQVAHYETHRKGEPSPTSMRFTIEDAKRAQLTGNPNWTKYPAAMLRARCITSLARAVYPDLAMGLYDPDELTSEPAPQRPYVVQEVKAPDVDAYSDLCQRIDQAESVVDVNEVAVEAKRRHTAGMVTDAQLTRVATAVKTRRAVLQAKPPSEVDPETGEVTP